PGSAAFFDPFAYLWSEKYNRCTPAVISRRKGQRVKEVLPTGEQHDDRSPPANSTTIVPRRRTARRSFSAGDERRFFSHRQAATRPDCPQPRTSGSTNPHAIRCP